MSPYISKLKFFTSSSIISQKNDGLANGSVIEDAVYLYILISDVGDGVGTLLFPAINKLLFLSKSILLIIKSVETFTEVGTSGPSSVPCSSPSSRAILYL